MRTPRPHQSTDRVYDVSVNTCINRNKQKLKKKKKQGVDLGSIYQQVHFNTCLN